MPVEAVITRREIDFSRPFFPARLTALAHVPSWGMLDECHRLRYSQLYALYLNEQTVFFEELLATNVLPALYRRPDRIGVDLAEDLRRFEAEERQQNRSKVHGEGSQGLSSHSQTPRGCNPWAGLIAPSY